MGKRNQVGQEGSKTGGGSSNRAATCLDLPCLQVIQPGEGLVALNMSANRDEEVFGPDADNFDIRRAPGPHMAFGFGRFVGVCWSWITI